MAPRAAAGANASWWTCSLCGYKHSPSHSCCSWCDKRLAPWNSANKNFGDELVAKGGKGRGGGTKKKERESAAGWGEWLAPSWVDIAKHDPKDAAFLANMQLLKEAGVKGLAAKKSPVEADGEEHGVPHDVSGMPHDVSGRTATKPGTTGSPELPTTTPPSAPTAGKQDLGALDPGNFDGAHGEGEADDEKLQALEEL